MALGRDADRLHEGQGLGDLVGQFAVLGAGGVVAREAQGPAMDVVQVGIAAAGEGPQQVQGRGRLVIGPDQTLGIGRALFRREPHAVDDVAAIAGQFDAVDLFQRRRARLGELTRDSADLHHRLASGEGQDDRHLQDQTKGVADIVGRELLEALGAVAALEQEGLAPLDLGQFRRQAARLAREDERRQGAQLVLDGGEGFGIWIVRRHVQGGLGSPAFGGPACHRARIGLCGRSNNENTNGFCR